LNIVPNCTSFTSVLQLTVIHPVRLAYQPPASRTFLLEQTSHQQAVISVFLSQQINNNHQPNEQVENQCKV
jgi:hypothetical protein